VEEAGPLGRPSRRLGEPSPDPRQRLGRQGERAAARALENAGLVILDRRYRTARGEIDLIAADGELVVFVEVKTRRGAGFGRPAEAVGSVKRQRLARVARHYLWHRRWSERPCRFDVVEVFVDRDGASSVRHLVDAFRLWPTG